MSTGISGSNTFLSAAAIAGAQLAGLAGIRRRARRSRGSASAAGGWSCGNHWQSVHVVYSVLTPSRLRAIAALQRMPREAGAFHPDRELAHAGERPTACRCPRPAAPAAVVTMRWNRWNSASRLRHRLSLERVGHQRRRRLRDRAAGALERDVRDHVAVELQVQRQPVAAQRVVALGLGGSASRCARKFRGRLLWSRMTSW